MKEPVDKMKKLKTIFICAAAGCLLANYPVLFFNKSYLSPIQGALYQGYPTVPGDSRQGEATDPGQGPKKDFFLEDYRGSDVGATAWWLGPITYVQHLSIFKYHEFPFWNRFVGCGLPLFEQGQIQITDPLQWIPILWRSEAWAWDLKFILSKFIFSLGIGVLVLQLTQALPAACLTAVSANFIGYYAFRFNHPAVFCLTYAPWVILSWLSIAENFKEKNRDFRKTYWLGAFHAILSLILLSGSAPKESIILFLGIQALGAFYFSTFQGISLKTKLVAVCGLLAGVFLISAPYWLNFLNLLTKSYTVYDSPSIGQFKFTDLLGFFDNTFFWEQNRHLTGPSVNLFVLFGLIASLLPDGQRDIKKTVTWVCLTFFASIAFGLVPGRMLVGIPLLNKIQHVGNCFAVPMILYSLILCGYGVAQFQKQRDPIQAAILLLFTLFILGIVVFNFRQADSIFKIQVKFGIQTVLTVCVSCLLACLILCWKFRPSGISSCLFGFLTLAFFAAHVRHGFHVPFGIRSIDANFVNPGLRVSFFRPSDALRRVQDMIQKQKQPIRVIGINEVFFPGFNCRYGLESLIVVDPLRSREFEDVLNAIDYPDMGWGWLRLVQQDKIPLVQHGLNMLNVGIVLAHKSSELGESFKKVEAEDLNLWINQEAWPRAFWTTDIVSAKNENFKTALAKRKKPFAWVGDSDYPKARMLNPPQTQSYLEAFDYRTKGNSTQFTVHANGPGVIVLTETETKGNWLLQVNDQTRDYFLVNGAFKGFLVEQPGLYKIKYTYRPQLLALSMGLALLGGVLTLIILGWAQASNVR